MAAEGEQCVAAARMVPGIAGVDLRRPVVRPERLAVAVCNVEQRPPSMMRRGALRVKFPRPVVRPERLAVAAEGGQCVAAARMVPRAAGVDLRRPVVRPERLAVAAEGCERDPLVGQHGCIRAAR